MYCRSTHPPDIRDRVVGEDGLRNPDLVREMEARGSVVSKTRLIRTVTTACVIGELLKEFASLVSRQRGDHQSRERAPRSLSPSFYMEKEVLCDTKRRGGGGLQQRAAESGSGDYTERRKDGRKGALPYYVNTERDYERD